MTFEGRQRPHDACDAAATMKLRDKAQQLLQGDENGLALECFLTVLGLCYNALDPTNDYDLDIG